MRPLLAFVAIATSAIVALPARSQTPTELRSLATAWYAYRDSLDPVGTSERGNHRFDARLSDARMRTIAARRARVTSLLDRVKGWKTATWSKDDRVDWLLFRAQLEYEDFFGRGLATEESDPQRYVGEIGTGVFSLLKKEYAPRRERALAAAARLEQVPAFLAIARTNLRTPVKLYAKLAIDAARGGDDLFTTSLMTLDEGLTPAERARLVAARDGAIRELHAFADWLEQRMPRMPDWKPMGEARYNYLLEHVWLLPYNATEVAMLGEVELARYRGLEAMLTHPEYASPDPARAARVPRDQADFLSTYESRLTEIVAHLRARQLVTIPAYIGKFSIRQLPEAFKPTSPGGFMNPPGIYDPDNEGFFFIPTYNPKSRNFYIRAAIEDPRPILGHEGLPGHFLQLSIANHLTNEIRRQHSDNPFAEGWGLYGEEMLLRTGLYVEQSPSHGQVLRAARYRAARVAVDVNLQTGRWTFEQAVEYFMDAGGLDREAAEGEAAGAASSPSQKIGYMVGKTQIMRLLGKYKEREGASFRLGAFHDRLLSYGTVPLSVIEWLMLDNQAAVERFLR